MNHVVERLADAAGGITRLATSLGVKHQSLYSWRRVPAERVIDVERVTGIPRHELRPDIYPVPAGDAAAGAGGEGGGVPASPPANVDIACPVRVRDA
jgi:DNA-binding transcriptional regulator YdaS (Cro superfamily)